MQLKSKPEATLANSAMDPAALSVDGVNVDRAVFVVPFDAPIPGELEHAEIKTGSLLNRLSTLSVESSEDADGVRFLLITGAELIAIDPAWKLINEHPRVYVLLDIPGAQYDVLFTQAIKRIGLKTFDWPTISEALASRVRVVQRITDSQPWALKKPPSVVGSEVPNDLAEPPADVDAI